MTLGTPGIVGITMTSTSSKTASYSSRSLRKRLCVFPWSYCDANESEPHVESPLAYLRVVFVGVHTVDEDVRGVGEELGRRCKCPDADLGQAASVV